MSRSWSGRGVKPTPRHLPPREGAIVWAPIVPDGGIVKPRRSVVVFDPRRDPNGYVWVVGVTSDGGEYDPANRARYDPGLYFPMPYAKDGSSPTTFTIPCAAKMTWVQSFAPDKVEATNGFLPPEELAALVAHLKAFRERLRAGEKGRGQR